METLLSQIKKCTICQAHLPLGVNPVLAAHPQSKVLIIGQAPGKKVHLSGIPWDDKSGDNLRNWLGVDKAAFYNTQNFALMPMGFCYPGAGKSGDLPPRKECAPQWHQQVLAQLQEVELVLLIGQYAQDYYLQGRSKASLTETVEHFQEYLPRFLPLPHPSPRNNIWMKKNPWFAEMLLPELAQRVAKILRGV